MIGKLIPAGTGRDFDRETNRRIAARAAQLKHEREERNAEAKAALEEATRRSEEGIVPNSADGDDSED